MLTNLTRTLAAATTSVLIAATALATPAMAGGQLSFSFAPHDAEQQQVLGLGLMALALVNGVSQPGANVRQNGNFNSAGFDQQGRHNNGLIVQDGNGHHGTVEQRGEDNTCALLQFGKNTRGECTQFGSRQTGVTTVFGF